MSFEPLLPKFKKLLIEPMIKYVDTFTTKKSPFSFLHKKKEHNPNYISKNSHNSDKQQIYDFINIHVTLAKSSDNPQNETTKTYS